MHRLYLGALLAFFLIITVSVQLNKKQQTIAIEQENAQLADVTLEPYAGPVQDSSFLESYTKEQERMQQEEKSKQQSAQAAWASRYCRDASNWNPPDGAALGRELANARGWGETEWEAINTLFGKESGWKGFVKQGNKWCVKFNYGGSGACGIPQAFPCSKIPDPMSLESQINWGYDYITKRYGSPMNALDFWYKNGWY